MRRFLFALFVCLTWTVSAQAGGWLFHRHDHTCGHEHAEKPHPTPDPGPKRHICHTHARAGFPLCFREHLEATNAGDSYGYYVGGGGGHGAGPRCREQGTYGWDYTGIHFPRKVILGWHGFRHHPDGGTYETNDPVEVPNVFTAQPLKAIHRHHEGGEE